MVQKSLAAKSRTALFSLGILLLGLSTSSESWGSSVCPKDAKLQGGKCSASLQTLFDQIPPAKLNSLKNDVPLTKKPEYATLFNDCMTYRSPASCNDVVTLGTIEGTNLPEYQATMNRMMIYTLRGARYENVEISGNGKVNFDPALVRPGEIGIVNVTVLHGKENSVFMRCKAELVVCGSGVGLSCPREQPMSCAPVANGPVSVSNNCACSDPSFPVLKSCINNVPVCEAAPATALCAAGEVHDGTSCKKTWDCSLADSSVQTARDAKCTTESVTVTPSTPGDYYPGTLTCSGTKTCASTPPGGGSCAAGNSWDGTNCTPCGSGEYTMVPDSPSCYKCTGGVVSADKTSCTACPTGTYSLGGTKCQPCGAGTFQDFTGQASCKPCTANIPGATGYSFSSTLGLKSESGCEPKANGCVAGYTISPDRTFCKQDGAPDAVRCPAMLLGWSQYSMSGSVGVASDILSEATEGSILPLSRDPFEFGGLDNRKKEELTATCSTGGNWRFSSPSVTPKESLPCNSKAPASTVTTPGGITTLPSVAFGYYMDTESMMCMVTTRPVSGKVSDAVYAYARLPAGMSCSGSGSSITGAVGGTCKKVQGTGDGRIVGYSTETWQVASYLSGAAVMGKWEKVGTISTFCTCE